MHTISVEDLFGWPTDGGDVTALCRWHITAALAERAEGDGIMLATRVRDGDDRLVVENGPRSRAVPPTPAEHEVAVPLAIPDRPGVYTVEIDAVVELKFWATWLGAPPAILRVERLADSGLRAVTADGFGPFLVPARGGQHFQVPHPRYGMDDTCRAVEIPWALSRYAGERRVLDIGYAFAEQRYLTALAALGIPHLVGLDLTVSDRYGAARVAADVRHPPFARAAFELIVAISVIEHIGRDNARYVGDTPDARQGDGDFRAVRALAALLAPGGRLLLTVPFGAAEDHGWFIQYDAARLDALASASGLTVAEAEYYRYDGAWGGPCPRATLRNCAYRSDRGSSSGVACLVLSLSRRRGPIVRRWCLSRRTARPRGSTDAT